MDASLVGIELVHNSVGGDKTHVVASDEYSHLPWLLISSLFGFDHGKSLLRTNITAESKNQNTPRMWRKTQNSSVVE
jgi:hypothetical protein